jgi:single-strand DNA-binding protein
MLNEPQVIIGGNLASDPELRYTPSGIAVAGFSVAQNPRYRDNASGEWRDGEPVFMRCTVWRDEAENLCQSLRRGDPVIVIGRIRQRVFTPDGEDNSRRLTEVTCDSVSVPLARRIVRLTKVTRERATDPAPDGAQDSPGDSPEPSAGQDEGAASGAATGRRKGRKPQTAT